MIQLGDLEGATRAFEHSVDLAPLRWGLMDLGYAYARTGRTAEAEVQIALLEESPGEPAWYEIALVLAALGRSAEAADLLGSACQERSYLLMQYGLWDPRLADLVGDDEVRDLRARMGRGVTQDPVRRRIRP